MGTMLFFYAICKQCGVVHICVRLNVIKFFINGNVAGTFTFDAPVLEAQAQRGLRIGGWQRSGECDWQGCLDEVRISNVSRYSGDFTPPTEPLTPDANTLLLIQADTHVTIWRRGKEGKSISDVLGDLPSGEPPVPTAEK